MLFLVGCEQTPGGCREADVKPAGAQFVAEAGHSPPFARMPYEAFSRAEAVAIAEQEWRLFGEHVDDDRRLQAASIRRRATTLRVLPVIGNGSASIGGSARMSIVVTRPGPGCMMRMAR